MNPEARVFTVYGRVQGVWFRDSTRREAERLALTGYAINLPDGNVEVLAWGTPESLRELGRVGHISSCRIEFRINTSPHGGDSTSENQHNTRRHDDPLRRPHTPTNSASFGSFQNHQKHLQQA